MNDFHEDDVTIEHARLSGGSGYLRLIHRPSGLSVDAHLKSEPVIKTKCALMSHLRAKVLGMDTELSREGHQESVVKT